MRANGQSINRRNAKALKLLRAYRTSGEIIQVTAVCWRGGEPSAAH